MSKLIPLKCNNGCNAPLELIDYEKMILQCEHCGTRYILSGFRESSEELKRKSAFLERARILMYDGDFSEADKIYDKLLLEAPHNAEAYLGKLKCKHEVVRDEELAMAEAPLYEDKLFIHALEYAEPKFRKKVAGYNEAIVERILKERNDVYEDKMNQYQKANRRLKQEIGKEDALKKKKEKLLSARAAIGVGAGIVDALTVLNYGTLLNGDCILILLFSFIIGMACIRFLDSYLKDDLQAQLEAAEKEKQKFENEVRELSSVIADVEADIGEITGKMKALEHVRPAEIIYE